MKLRAPVVIALGLGVFAMLYSKRAWSVPSRAQPFLSLLRSAEATFGIPTNLLVRQAQQESNFNPLARSYAGAVGLMQIIPRWHPTLSPGDAAEDEMAALDPTKAVPYAARYLALLRQRFGSWSKALAAYNWGQGNLTTYLKRIGPNADWTKGLPKETRDYVNKIAGDIGLPI